MHSRDRVTSSFFILLELCLPSPRISLIEQILLFVLLFRRFYHSFLIKLLIPIFRFVYGILKFFAAYPACLFSLIPVWLGIQLSTISLLFDNESNLHNTFIYKGLLSVLFFIAIITDWESENITCFSFLFMEMKFIARPLPQISSWNLLLKFEISSGRCFFYFPITYCCIFCCLFVFLYIYEGVWMFGVAFFDFLKFLLDLKRVSACFMIFVEVYFWHFYGSRRYHWYGGIMDFR